MNSKLAYRKRVINTSEQNSLKKSFKSNCVTMEKNKSTNLCDVAEYCIIVQTNHSLLTKRQFRRHKEVQLLFFFLKLLFSAVTNVYLCNDK